MYAKIVDFYKRFFVKFRLFDSIFKYIHTFEIIAKSKKDWNKNVCYKISTI